MMMIDDNDDRHWGYDHYDIDSASIMMSDEEEEEEEEEDTEEEEEEVVDTSMSISDSERAWALQLKNAVETSPDFENLTDMEYARHALAAKGDFKRAMTRIKGLQQFRQDYKVDDTVDQGMYYLERFMRLQPGTLLHIDTCPDTGEGVIGWDQSALDPALALCCSADDAVLEEKWKVHAIAYYYIQSIVQPSVQSTREGIFYLIDSMNMKWKNFSLLYETRMHQEMIMHLPFKVKKVMVYNTNTVSVLAWSLLKPILPKETKYTLELGCQVLDDRGGVKSDMTLGELYLQPTFEEARDHVLKRAKELLSLRWKNETSFQL